MNIIFTVKILRENTVLVAVGGLGLLLLIILIVLITLCRRLKRGKHNNDI